MTVRAYMDMGMGGLFRQCGEVRNSRAELLDDGKLRHGRALLSKVCRNRTELRDDGELRNNPNGLQSGRMVHSRRQPRMLTLLFAAVALTASAGEWEKIAPGGETSCSDGSNYHFFVREASAKKLVFYLQGGGACWSRETCDAQLKPSYSINLERTDPSRYDGIVNYDNPENPLKSHSAVFVPYCTGDVHLGARDAEYPPVADTGPGSGTLKIRHRGAINVQAALDYAAERFPAARRILVTGSSAGAIPSPFYALKLAERYPNARVVQLGDGAGGYRRADPADGAPGFNPVPVWGADRVLGAHPAFAGLDMETFGYEMLYIRAGEHRPDIRLASYDTAEDDVQKRYMALSGTPAERLLDLLRANLADIREKVPGFRAFVAGGELHTVLLRPEFYTYAVGRRSVRDWVAALAAGRSVRDTECSDCSQPEFVTRRR